MNKGIVLILEYLLTEIILGAYQSCSSSQLGYLLVGSKSYYITSFSKSQLSRVLINTF